MSDVVKEKKVLLATKADDEVRTCLEDKKSFAMVAGAGSGKTTSLITALELIRERFAVGMRRSGQRVVCVTYTNRAVDVIFSRLGWDDLFLVSTLHAFLWEEVKRFPVDIRKALQESIIPMAVEKKRQDDNGGGSQKALAAREKVKNLEEDAVALNDVSRFNYGDSSFSDYRTGELGHDDVISIAAHMISTSQQLRRVIGQKYPYIFVDEAQDTHENVVSALNTLCETPGLPLVGYFGDPMQQIYDKRAGSFAGPVDSRRITKEENFRCSSAVIGLLNAFRTDVQQVAAGSNASVDGSVIIRLIEAEEPEGPRKKYSNEQMIRASSRLDAALGDWGWASRSDVKHLYLVRQMIARRLGFGGLHSLFTGTYASSRAQEDYESGEHFLLKPFVVVLYPLIRASAAGTSRRTIDLLRQHSPEFDPAGKNAKLSLGAMSTRASLLVSQVNSLWNSATAGEVLRFARDSGLIQSSKRLGEHLDRDRRAEEYDDESHSKEKGDWLADQFFSMDLREIERFCEFIAENTVFSTQHGVKGEQYGKVLVVFDDVGSAWSNYSFSKTLVPNTAGAPTERQQRLSENLAYVCFSRAEVDLRIAMFVANAKAARQELIDRCLFGPSQIEIHS